MMLKSLSRRSYKHLLLAGFALALAQGPAHAAALQFDDASVAELQAAMKAGTLTSEKLVQLCIARIEAYDKQGPKLHAVMALNPKALEEARALDAELKAKGPRSPVHGIPVILKDNYDTVAMPTTGGSVLLEGSIPPKDAFLVKKLRDAGAIILAKVNLSEFAAGGTMSSLGGQSLNPHDLTRSPSGSSGGTGVGIAAGYAPLGMGTDTGGSIRGPAAANGVVALKPTHGLLSRAGIIPLALSFDTGGPFGRNVSDIAGMLSVMTGVDPADDATKKQEGKVEKDYAKFLKADALKGTRIGVLRDFMGADADVDWVINAALDQMKKAGATLVDVRYPKWLLEGRAEFYTAVRWPEFPVQFNQYLATLGPKYPKTLNEMIERAEKFTEARPDGARPNTTRWTLFKQEAASGSMTDYKYTSVKEHVIPAIRQVVDGVMAANKLDAMVYPTSGGKTPLIAGTLERNARPGAGGGGGTNMANFTGYPDLIVPAGFTGDALPVGISFVAGAFSEGKLISYGYSFEQATHARHRPVHTPPLPGATIDTKGGN
ncbi:MAG: amidase [Rhodospirillaceae bacterium]|nr:amidase [Rhodospirillaceae bacterium]